MRNPIDVIPSIANQMATASHSLSSAVPINEVDAGFWDRLVRVFVPAMNLNTQWMREKLEPAVPIYWVRYEDLVLNPKPALLELFSFMLDVPSLEGTVCEKRIIDYCAKGSEAATVYKMKAQPTRNMSRNAGMYTPEQIEFMKEAGREYLYYFGYVDHPT